MNALKPYPWQVASLILVACYWAMHLSLQPYLIKVIIDKVNTDPSFHSLLWPIVFYIIISLAFTLNFRFYDYVCLKFYPKFKAKIIDDATETISHHSYRFFQNQFSGSLSDKVKNLSTGIVEIVTKVIDRFFSHALGLSIASITLMTVNVWLGIILLSWACFLVLLTFGTTKEGNHLSHELSEANSSTVGNIVDRFSNILNVKLFSSYGYEKCKLRHNLENVIKKDQNLRWFLLKILTIQGLATASMISGCLLILIFSVQTHYITVGDFALVLTLTLSIADIIWNLTHDIAKFSETYGLVSQGLSLLQEPHEIVDVANAKTLLVTKGEIRFQKVHFKYENAEPLFSEKSITLLAGEKVGLVGYSGSGKSTFVNLILRLFDVDSGHIYIDDQDITKVTQDSLHQNIAMIPQEPTLFHRSLMENIRYGNLESSENEIIEAAKRAHADEFIKVLPQGYHTLVGERGIKLSGGQRQRVAIARAILKDAPILLLDEATSALDSVTENIIKNTLIELMKNKTTIVIAHRLSTLLNMDRILVFDQGKIVEDGTHTALLSAGGLYKQLWDAQVGGFIPDKIDNNKGDDSH